VRGLSRVCSEAAAYVLWYAQMPPKKQHAAMWLAKLLAAAPNGKRKAWHLARLLTANLNKKGKRALKSKYNALFRKGSFVLHAPKQFRHDVVFLLHKHGVQTQTIVRNMALDLEITGVRKTHALRKVSAPTCALCACMT
tara:strand:- start:27 stop:443 length:417 start_codon:yes stop_codon:yes gene_type:complete